MPRPRRLRYERTVPLNVPIPYPLRDRLDALQELLDQTGLPGVPIREIVATALLYVEEDAAKLRQMVEDYRDAEPGAAVIGGIAGGGKVVPFAARSAGRPPKK